MDRAKERGIGGMTQRGAISWTKNFSEGVSMVLIDLATSRARTWAERLHRDGISVEELAMLLGLRRSDASAVLNGNLILMPESEQRLYAALDVIERSRRETKRKRSTLS